MAPSRLLLALAQVAVLTYALAAACVLASVWTRRASDAILGCYSAIVVAYFIGAVLASVVALPWWLNPVEILQRLIRSTTSAPGWAHLFHLAVWGAAGAFFHLVAVARLRPASRQQADRRLPRWLWALRPAIGNDPVRWRERHVLGLAPLPILRTVPTWLAMLSVLIVSAVFAVSALDHATHNLLSALQSGDLATAHQAIQRVQADRLWGDITMMGVILVVLASLTVGVRCAASIAEEKRRKTWDDLRLTTLTLEEIVRGKKWGVLQAAVPYLLVYTVPMFALAGMIGQEGIITVLWWLVGSAVALLIAAEVGASMSLTAEEMDISPQPLRSYVPHRPDVREETTRPWTHDESIIPDRRRYTD